MPNGTPQLFEFAMRRLRRLQLMALALGIVTFSLLSYLVYYGQNTNNGILNDVPALLEAEKNTTRLISLSGQLDTATTEERSDLLKEMIANLYSLEGQEAIIRNQSANSKSMPAIADALAEFRQLCEQLIYRTAATPDEINKATDALSILTMDRIIQPIQFNIQSKLNQRDARSARRHVFISAMGSAIVLLLFITLILGPVSTLRLSKKTKRQLVKMNRLKGDYLANLTHELRTPINGIVGMSDLMLEHAHTPQIQHYARTVQSSADHLLCLVNDVLDFSKLEAGHMKLSPTSIDLHELAQDVLMIMAGRANSKKLELLLDYDTESPSLIEADPARIKQIMFNLIGNAIKFTDAGYVLLSITVKTGRTPMLFCEVEDTGAGIPENKISQLFKKYAQIENTSNKAKDGTGLGLAICRSLLHLMGGEIKVRSAPGRGTVFIWRMPVVLNKAAATQKIVPLLRDKKIIVMDDLSPNRKMYQQALKAHGAISIMTENAEETLSRLGYELSCNRVPDFIVLDQQIPGSSGIECAKQIRSKPEFAHIPIALLTIGAQSRLIDDMASMGNMTNIAKPLSAQTLCEVIHATLSGKASTQDQKEIAKTTSFELSILLAEDNRVNAEISTEMLQSFGCKVTLAENGMRALELAQTNKYDIVLMDCQMPVMDGFEAAQRISQQMKLGKIVTTPIIALTANAADGDKDLCFESGMIDYLCKPVRKNEMEAMLRKWAKPSAIIMPAAPAPQPAPKASADMLNGIDVSQFNGACTALGKKAGTVIDYFIEDSETYLDDFKKAMENKAYRDAILPAHTLKSSSKQFGLMQMSELAERAEKLLRQHASADFAGENVAALLEGLQHSFARGKAFLLEQKGNPSLSA